MSDWDGNPLRNSAMKSKHTLLALLLPRIYDMIFIVVFIGAVLVGPRMINGDLGRHLALGKYMVTTSTIPTSDLFSFTKAGQPRPPYEWLAQVSFYILYLLLDLDGIVLLTALVLASAFSNVYIDSVRRSGMPILASMLTLWAAIASSLDWLTRPQVFSFLFFAIWVQWLEKLRRGEKMSIWFFPALMLIWANTHGGFVFGILAWFAYLAGWVWESWRKSAHARAGKKLLIVGGTSLIATILTPDLWRNWQGVFGNNSIYILSHTSETMPPNFAAPGTLPFAALLIFALLLIGFGWKRIPAGHIFMLVGFAAMSLVMARNIPFFAITAAPILAGYISQTFIIKSLWRNLEEGVTGIDSTLRGHVWPVLILFAITGFFAYYQTRAHDSFDQFSPQMFPVQAADWIESHPQEGYMFNDFNWGGYLLFRLWPGSQVFIDSQSDFYGETLTRQYAGIINGEGDWETELRKYHVRWIIVPRDAGLTQKALASPDWKIIYEDSVAAIFSRR